MRRGLKIGLGALGVTAALAAGRIAYVQWYFSTLPYEAKIHDLVDNPKLFRHAILDVYEDVHKNRLETKSEGTVDYRITARFATDTENFLRDRVVVDFPQSSLKPEESEFVKNFYDGISRSVGECRDYIERMRKKLNELNPELPDLLLKELERYENWQKPVKLEYVDYFRNFDPPRKDRKENDLDRHIARTLRTDSSPGPFDQEELEAARKYLFEASERQDVDLSSLSVRESVEFLRESLNKNFLYVAYESELPGSFTNFTGVRKGNSPEFSYHGSRLFDLMREYNPQLKNTHVFPTLLKSSLFHDYGRVISTIFQTDKEEFSLVDFSNQSKQPSRELKRMKVIVWKH